MKVAVYYDVCMEMDLPVKVVKELYNARLKDGPFPQSVNKAIMATPEWQDLTKLNVEFELSAIYNPDYEKKGNEMPNKEVLWEE